MPGWLPIKVKEGGVPSINCTMRIPCFLLLITTLIVSVHSVLLAGAPAIASIVDFSIKLYTSDPENRAFALVGSLCGDAESILADSTDKIGPKLDDVSERLNSLYEKMENRFAQFKSDLKDQDFEKVKGDIDNMAKFANDLIKNPKDKEKRAMFLGNESVTLKNLLKLSKYLRSKILNPIIPRIEKDKHRSRKIEINGVADMNALMEKALFTNAFEYGFKNNQSEMLEQLKKLSKDENTKASEMQVELLLTTPYFKESSLAWKETLAVKEWLASYMESYKSNNDYWPSVVENIVNNRIKEHIDINKYLKADRLQMELSEIYANDRFFIVVRENCQKTCQISTESIGANEMELNKKHLEFKWKQSQITIYRSRTAYNISKIDENVMEEFFANRKFAEIMFRNVTENNGNYKLLNCSAMIKYAREWISLKAKMSVIAANLACDISQVAWTGDIQRGPGWWIQGVVEQCKYPKPTALCEHHLIVGYP